MPTWSMLDLHYLWSIKLFTTILLTVNHLLHFIPILFSYYYFIFMATVVSDIGHIIGIKCLIHVKLDSFCKILLIKTYWIIQRFAAAAEAVKALTKRPTDDELLELYALFKQASVGDNNTRKYMLRNCSRSVLGWSLQGNFRISKCTLLRSLPN